MSLFGSIDNEIEIMLLLSLDDLRSYRQINKHYYQLCKTNKILNNKFIQLDQKINNILEALDSHPIQGLYLNTVKQYDLFGPYKQIMYNLFKTYKQKMNKLNFDSNIKNYYHINVNTYEIISINIHKQINQNTQQQFDIYYTIKYNLVDDIDEKTDYFICDLVPLKEFLLQLYYNNLLLNI